MRRRVIAVYICQNFGGTFCFFTLKIEAACPSETLSTNETTRNHTVEECSVDESGCKQKPHLYYYMHKRTQNI